MFVLMQLKMALFSITFCHNINRYTVCIHTKPMLPVADCINIGYFNQWIRDNQWITLSNLVMLSNLDNPLYKTIFRTSNIWIKNNQLL